MRILSPKQVQSLGSEVVETGWEPIFRTRKLCALTPVMSVCFGGSFQALQAGGALGELGFPQEGSHSSLVPAAPWGLTHVSSFPCHWVV